MSTDDIDDIYEHLSKYESLIGVRPSQREPGKARVSQEAYGRRHKKPLVLLPKREAFTLSLRWQSAVVLAGILFAVTGLVFIVGGISTLGSGNISTGELTVTGGLVVYSLGLVAFIFGTGNILKGRSESSMQKNLEEIREQNRIIIELLRKITNELIFGF
ncbi:hypothetical protein [Methanoregula sp.]|uniref:hypothetical protein n=1 Tax=Methanoregula sp. TaxID=2052170 RepID=UPI002C314E10|nr:hypothetical protein [Methanoregula sp.]HVP96127.1 hypothetical protein [Methanoregula sp.]